MRKVTWASGVVMVLGTAMWANAQATTQPAAPQLTTPQPAPGAAPAKALPADQMLSQMLRQNGSGNTSGKPLQPLPTDKPAIDRTSGGRALAPGAPAVSVMREGTYVVDRVGRLTRAVEGQQAEFTFDSDGRALRDPPVVILPNLKLMQMENAVQASNRDLRFRITGMVTEYRGRNYVLLDKVVVVPDARQQF